MAKDVASLSELKRFCNRVRRAGGGKEIKDLMPGYPGNANECLIAKNLNFNCAVRPAPGETARGEWRMYISDSTTAEKIAKTAKLQFIKARYPNAAAVVLPARISAVARGFDDVTRLFRGVKSTSVYIDEAYKLQLKEELLTAADRQLVKKYWKYIQPSERKNWVKPKFI